jgi:signal transduction histidine kinase
VSPRLARWASRAILLVATTAVITSVPIWFANQREADRTSIVVVGDPNAPRIDALVSELEQELQERGSFLPGGPNPAFVLIFGVCLGWIAVGSLIVARQPGNWAGWLFIIVGVPLPLLSLSQSIVVYGTRVRGADVPGLTFWALLGEYVLYPVAVLPLLFLLYPDGSLPSPRWRWAVRGLLAGVALAIVGFALRPGPLNGWLESGILFVNPLGVDVFGDLGGPLIATGAVLALGSAASTVVAVRQRFRRASGEERQRMRWLRFVATAAGVTFLAQWLLVPVFEVLGQDVETPVFDILWGLTALILALGIPVAYLVAIFRYGLWELDLVIRKTVRYALLVVVFTTIGALVVVAVPALVFGVGGGTPLLLVLALSGIIAAAFLWVRPRASRLADRIVYGRRATPYEVLSSFSERVGGTYSTQDVLPRMAQLVGEATGALEVAVWVRVGPTLTPEATWPPEAAAPPPRNLERDSVPARERERVVEVRHQGELLGAITLVPAPDDPLDAAKESLLRDLASQAGLVLGNVRLIEELKAAQRRLVAAQDQERRRIERNIHDGAQQQLVALSVKMRLARSLAMTDADKAGGLLEQMQEDVQTALEDLRDLARGIYPPLLADRGLATALEAQLRKAAVPVELSAEHLDRYAPDVEAAVYFSVLEALQNVAKYAQATQVSVRLHVVDGMLTFAVEDDGRGFDPSANGYGSGLQGMADRLSALEGRVEVRSRPGEGTTVSGRVPAQV